MNCNLQLYNLGMLTTLISFTDTQMKYYLFAG